MKYINLLSILESKNKLSDELFKKYLKYQNVNILDHEVGDLLQLTQKLLAESRDSNIFNGYYIGYKIPQISKEFDLLKITKNSVINIELKSGSDKEKIKEQLIKNKYYLKSLEKDKIYNITYQSKEDKLYILNEKDELNKLEVKDLIEILSEGLPLQVDLNSLFDPSEFLVSPFNNPDTFIEGKYFLTGQQKEFKEKIIELVKKNRYGFYAISGKAGTGKTLLVYDIAKELRDNGKKILIVHCGKLNKGHEILRDNNNINIISAKDFTQIEVDKNYDLIIFDESQRIRKNQLDIVLQNKKKSNFLFSYDKNQTLSGKDGKYGTKTAADMFKKIKKHFKLSENIRTNKEIASFIRRFINKKENAYPRQYKNITIQNFESMDYVTDYIKNLEEKGWTYISYTPKKHGEKGIYQKYNIAPDYSVQNAHDVIGQEFDNVVVIIGDGILYKETGELTYNISGDTSVPFLPHKMLFQAMTRARKKLELIIVNNPVILKRCLEILIESKK